ncbi:hypothetical protein A4H97_06620 [Niastella yeongjuensis]|uniref:O-antigen ligase-related domain-containing protein n=1 Tax=Niastella yeongjuensis TaxID=354355 RepID=A0A1V9EM28_9BACT|nr:O-antigen ligase family protein [Niastella yeongjuensis]OQP47176.1 hypothetical protein A4H97_06620 [Niastella yeongjuensis]SEN72891.1 hypothetical protein SAMN05660816_01350 [Niastella yeongjuensis]
MRINKFFPVVFIYFFINSWGLPFGLTYTALLSPLLYIWMIITRKREVLWPFLLVMLPVVLIHLAIGVDANSYFVSLLNMTLVYIFCQAVYTFLIRCEQPGKIFHHLLVINFICCLIAIPLLFTPLYDLFWMKQFLTTGVTDFRRLSLLTYEPSYYALLFTPLFFFFLLQLLFFRNTINAWLLLVMLLLPLVLSFSLGVISAIAIAVVITFVSYYKKFLHNKRVISLLGLIGIVILSALAVGFIFFPDNILFVRLDNVVSGKDPSGKGRTFDAFWLADQLLAKKSYLWGIGPGQIKILGFELIRDFYGYGTDTARVAIPNAAAETLAIFGWIGLSVRILAECILFVYTKVWCNYYRLLLFVFVFIYQFTGSFITNIAEYVIWIMAFTAVFPEYDVIKENE